jgi:hypothetical protein
MISSIIVASSHRQVRRQIQFAWCFVIKPIALGLLFSLSLSCAAQQRSQLCRISSGLLAGKIEAAESSGFVGSSCSTAAGDRGVYVSSGEETKNYDHRDQGRSPASAAPEPTHESPHAQPAPVPRPASAPPAAAPAPPPPADGAEAPDMQPVQESHQPPQQHHAPVHHAAAPVAAAAPAAQSPAQQVHQWYEDLPVGSVKYHVPTNMVLGESYAATAVLTPPGSTEAPGAGDRPLKVSTYMRIVLAQPDNPGTFEVQPEQGICKFVSIDADTTWTFLVKPILPGENKHVSFSAYAVYGVDDSSCSPDNLKLINVLSDTETVTISAITGKRAWQQIVVSFLSDPVKWIKVILPGGTGFAVIAGLIAWWRKRRAAARVSK